MEMHDMGESAGNEIPQTEGEGKKEKYYPSVSLTTEQLPELGSKEIGNEVSLHIMGKIRGIRKDKEKTSYDIELRECGMMGGEIPDEDEYKKMSREEQDEADEKEVMGRH
ncbi:MAG TPA: hypothetical protein DHV62_07755 [Elusimicrobia bacterium]|nr:hypothetical protein [Elusimicrobiota bacterium]